ncbi:MAG TPA: ATP-grasp domain-containing protein [Verrucomicrobiae bacterium]|nr:ATP-grasp domain-containing protein [Verrucomicrobiae bacterium]
MKLNVLVMSAGSIPGVAIIEALRNQNEVPVRLIGADMGRLSAGFLLADASHVVSGAHQSDFIPSILAICRQEQVHVIFPVIDEELQTFADHAPTFTAEGIRVITNPPELVRVAKDKSLTARRCAELGVLAPPTLLKDDLGRVPLPPFPLVVKPRDGRGTVGVHIVRDKHELDFFLDRVSNAMIQQFIEGAEFTIDVLTDFDGNLISLVPKQRLQVKAGMQVKGRTVKDPQLLAYGAEIVRKFGLVPRGNIQCIRAVDGSLYLIEINPKFPASLPFTLRAGVNGPLLLLKMHLGQKIAPMIGQFQENLVMMRVWRELYTHDQVS